MTKTLAQLKRDLVKGASVTLIESLTMPEHKHLNVPRYVVGVQSNGVTLSPEQDAVKGSFMDFPKSSLMEYVGTTLKIFNVGERDLTEAERKIKDGCPRDDKQEEIDLMTDGSVMFYREKRYYKEQGAEYLRGLNWQAGKKYSFNTSKVMDESIKGSLDRVYSINA